MKKKTTIARKTWNQHFLVGSLTGNLDEWVLKEAPPLLYKSLACWCWIIDVGEGEIPVEPGIIFSVSVALTFKWKGFCPPYIVLKKYSTRDSASKTGSWVNDLVADTSLNFKDSRFWWKTKNKSKKKLDLT